MLNLMLSAVQAYTVYTVFSIIFMVIMVLLSSARVIIVVLQQGNSGTIGAITGSTESFFGKNKARSLDGKLKRWTVGIAAAILVSSILFFVFQILKNAL